MNNEQTPKIIVVRDLVKLRPLPEDFEPGIIKIPVFPWQDPIFGQVEQENK